MVKQVQKTLTSNLGKKSGPAKGWLKKSVDFPEELETADPEMTSSMALHSLHTFIKKNKIWNLSHIH